MFLIYKYLPVNRLNKIYQYIKMHLFRFLISVFFLAAGSLFSQTPRNDFRVNDLILWDQTRPAIAADAAGNFVAVWASGVTWNESTGQELTEIYARLFTTDGTPRGPEVQVNEIWTHIQEQPRVAMGENGSFVVTWVSYWIERTGFVGISARIFDQNGVPQGPEFLVNEYVADYQGNPDIAMDAAGNFVIVWQSWDQDGDGYGIYAQRYSQTGQPLTSDFQVNLFQESDQMQPAIAMDSQGYFVITWTSYGQDGSETGIFARRFDPFGSSLSNEIPVNFSTAGWQEWPDIIMDDMGNFIICWHSNHNMSESYDIYTRTFDRSAALKGPEILVNAPSSAWQIFPSLGSDADGNFIITWQSADTPDNTFNLYARVFNQYGNPQGDQFPVNTSTLHNLEYPDMFMLSTDNFGIIWQSQTTNDSDWDIYIRLFNNLAGSLVKPGETFKKKHEKRKFLGLLPRFLHSSFSFGF